MMTPKHVSDWYPSTKSKAWPPDIGDPPSPEALHIARVSGELGSAVSMAIAMRARTKNGRPYGATGPEVAAAVLFASGAATGQHGNKFRDWVSAGRYIVTGGSTTIKGKPIKGQPIAMRGGIEPVAIGLPPAS